MLFDTVLAFDHVQHRILLIANARISADDDLESIRSIVEEFNAQSETTEVTLEQVPGSETDSAKLITAVRGGTGPDELLDGGQAGPDDGGAVHVGSFRIHLATSTTVAARVGLPSSGNRTK